MFVAAETDRRSARARTKRGRRDQPPAANTPSPPSTRQRRRATASSSSSPPPPPPPPARPLALRIAHVARDDDRVGRDARDPRAVLRRTGADRGRRATGAHAFRARRFAPVTRGHMVSVVVVVVVVVGSRQALSSCAAPRKPADIINLSFSLSHTLAQYFSLSCRSFVSLFSSLSFFSLFPGEDSFSLRLLLAAADAGGGGVLERESFDGLTYRATGSTLLLAIKVRSSQPRVVAYRLSPFLTARMSRRDACCSRSSTTTPGRGPRSPVRRARGA